MPVSRVWGLSAAVAAAATPCFPPMDRPSQGVTLRLLQRDWASHRLVTSVAAILLREKLMFDVEVIPPPANSDTQADFQRLATSEIDANMEVWPRGKEAEYQRWVAHGAVVDAGMHKVASRTGMFVTRNDSAFYARLRDPAAQELYSKATVAQGEQGADLANYCADPAWNCSNLIWRPPQCGPVQPGAKDPCRAQLLKGDTGYDTGVMEQQIKNSGLNVSIAYVTPATLSQKVWAAHGKGEHVLFYSWTPREPMHGIPSSEVTPVEFPPATPECLGSNNDKPTGGLDCDLGITGLKKLVSPRLAEARDALRFVQTFALAAEDYEALFTLQALTQSDDQAACMWLREVGESRWGQWAAFTQGAPHSLFSMPGWSYVHLQIAAAALISLVSWTSARYRRSASMREAALARAGSGTAEVHNALDTPMEFLGHTRSERNFLLPAADSQALAPPRAAVPMRGELRRIDMLRYMVSSKLAQCLRTSLTLSLLAGAWGSFVHILMRHMEMNLAANPKGPEHFERFSTNAMLMVTSFQFFPVFLLGFFVNKEASRWVGYVDMSFAVWGRCEDLAMILAGAISGTNDPATMAERRTLLYRFYRYINVVHYMAYIGLDPRVPTEVMDVGEALEKVELLTKSELLELRFAPHKPRQAVLSWISVLWHDLVRSGVVSAPHGDTICFMDKLTALRTATVVYIEKTPHLITVMLKFVVGISLIFFSLAYPMTTYLSTSGYLQPLAMATIFCLSFSYVGPLEILDTLQKTPFVASGENINVDNIMCEVELVCFHAMRASFREAVPQPMGLSGDLAVLDHQHLESQAECAKLPGHVADLASSDAMAMCSI